MKQTQDYTQRLFKKIARVFITNPELGVLTLIFIVFFGIVGFVLMPKQYNPDIVAPAFRINTAFPNATAEEVHELISRPMENKIREIAGVDKIYSESRAGMSSVLVTFDVGSDKEDAQIRLAQRFRSNMDEKPLGARDPMIEEVDTDDVPIVTLAIFSDRFSQEALRSFAFDLTDRLKHVSGTGKMDVYGGARADMVVSVDTEKMAARGVTVDAIMQAITQNNVHHLATETDHDVLHIPVRLFGNVTDCDDLKKMIVVRRGDSVVRIEDVADVRVGEMRTNHHVHFTDHTGQKDAVYIGIAKKNGTNATTVSRDIHTEIAALTDRGFIPHGVHVEVVRDDGAVARESVGALMRSLMTSIVIVVLVLLFFLNTRSALIVAIAIPLSLLSVFGFGALFGETINRITLFALILSLGLLVDNATVVVENMYRHVKKRTGENKADVITDAVGEVGGGLVMSTITTVLAFIPMAFVTGMMGPYMGPIPFFVPCAIIASLFIALTINPFIGKIFLRAEDTKEQIVTRIQKRVRRIFGGIETRYAHFLRRVLHNRRTSITLLFGVVVLLLFSISLPLFTAVKFRMLPKADRDQFYVYIDAPHNTHITQTTRITQNIVQTILAQDGVVSTQSTIGTPPIVDFNGLFKGSDGRFGDHLATVKVNLVNKKDRAQTSEDIAIATRSALQGTAAKENVNIKIIEDPPGPPVLATYHIKAQGETSADLPVLEQIADDLSRVSHDIAGVVDVDTTRAEHGFEKVFRVKTDYAHRVGVDVATIFQSLHVLSHGTYVGLYHTNDANHTFREQHYISVIGDADTRTSFDDLHHVTVRSHGGDAVALTALIEEVDAPVNAIIQTDEQYPTVYVSGEMEKGSVVYASIDMLRYLVTEYRLPSGNGVVESWNLFGVTYRDADGAQYHVRIGGEWQLTLEVFRDFGIAFVVAIFLIYFVLVAQFRSLKVPLYVMATIPLSLIGVLPGFMILYVIKGTYFNATSMIGVIALSGIVVNNAIIYLEYVFQQKNAGVRIDDALIDAGRTRLLPIVLTSLTTILGSLTIISDPVWEGLAWAIITGLSLSSFLTLGILPILYYLFERK